MAYKFSKRSLTNLKGVHPTLVKVVYRALELTTVDFCVTDGLRTVEEQRINVRKGVSKTMKSRHLTGHAVDIVPWGDFDGDGDVDGTDLYNFASEYHKIAEAMKQAAKEYSLDIEWGYDKWGWDMPHWQMSWAKYPA